MGIEKIFCGSKDPLHGSDMEVIQGPIGDECKALNKFFFCWAQKKRPFITVKIARTADGFVAGKNGEPIRITSLQQDRKVHQLRARHQAIMVGSNTVLNDDCHLGVRHADGSDPLRIILDSQKPDSQNCKGFSRQ